MEKTFEFIAIAPFALALAFIIQTALALMVLP